MAWLAEALRAELTAFMTAFNVPLAVNEPAGAGAVWPRAARSRPPKSTPRRLQMFGAEASVTSSAALAESKAAGRDKVQKGKEEWRIKRVT